MQSTGSGSLFFERVVLRTGRSINLDFHPTIRAHYANKSIGCNVDEVANVCICISCETPFRPCVISQRGTSVTFSYF